MEGFCLEHVAQTTSCCVYYTRRENITLDNAVILLIIAVLL